MLRRSEPVASEGHTERIAMYYVNEYVIQWDRVQSIEDIKKILQAINPRFEPDCQALPLVQYLCEMQRKVPGSTIPLPT